MFTQRSSVARRAHQCISLLRRQNTCPGKIVSFSFEILHKSPLFSFEIPLGFSSNDGFPRAFVPLHLQTGFRYFSANPLQSRAFQANAFSELDAKETKEAEGSDVEISSQSKTIDLLFKEAIGLDEILETKRLALGFEGLSDLTPEDQVEKLKSKLESNCDFVNRLMEDADGLENKINELNKRQASLLNTKNQKAQRLIESKKSSIDTKTEAVPNLSSIFFCFSKQQKESVKAEQKKIKKKRKLQKKENGVSGSLEHPWPEWVQFLGHLNEKGYLSKALSFTRGPVDLRGLSTDELYGFIKFAAVTFVKDHPEISKLLSGSDVRKAVLFGSPSVEIKVVMAARRLRSFFSIEEDTADIPVNLEYTNNAPSAVVSKVKSVDLEDLVRLLCAFGLNAEKNEISIPDEIKQSVVNLLKELVDFSTSIVNDG